jgi:hypothetical protein
LTRRRKPAMEANPGQRSQARRNIQRRCNIRGRSPGKNKGEFHRHLIETGVVHARMRRTPSSGGWDQEECGE